MVAVNNKTRWVAFDLETTADGARRILQVAAQVFHPVDWASPSPPPPPPPPFSTYVKETQVGMYTTKITGITDRMLVNAPPLRVALMGFMRWLRAVHPPDHSLALVAHNGGSFDFRVLLSALHELHKLDGVAGFAGSGMRAEGVRFLDSKDLFLLSPLEVMRGNVHSKQWSLGHIYQVVHGRPLVGAHDARHDVQALCSIASLYREHMLLEHARRPEQLRVPAEHLSSFYPPSEWASKQPARQPFVVAAKEEEEEEEEAPLQEAVKVVKDVTASEDAVDAPRRRIKKIVTPPVVSPPASPPIPDPLLSEKTLGAKVVMSASAVTSPPMPLTSRPSLDVLSPVPTPPPSPPPPSPTMGKYRL